MRRHGAGTRYQAACRLQGISMMPNATDAAINMLLSEFSAAQPCGDPEPH